jgi:hypothetical protein
MSDQEKRGAAGREAFAALATLAKVLNEALNNGQEMDLSLRSGERGLRADGYSFTLVVRPLAEGEVPHYSPAGVI